jgi:hypothetical protein
VSPRTAPTAADRRVSRWHVAAGYKGASGTGALSAVSSVAGTGPPLLPYYPMVLHRGGYPDGS